MKFKNSIDQLSELNEKLRESSLFPSRDLFQCVTRFLVILETYVELFQEKDIGVLPCRNRFESITPVDEHLYTQLLQRFPDESQFPANGGVVLPPSS